MHSGAFSLSDDPIQVQAEVVQLKDVVKEKEQVSLFDEAELEQLLAELDLSTDPHEDKPVPQKKAKDEKNKPSFVENSP